MGLVLLTATSLTLSGFMLHSSTQFLIISFTSCKLDATSTLDVEEDDICKVLDDGVVVNAWFPLLDRDERFR
jgi:hypothetical protein